MKIKNSFCKVFKALVTNYATNQSFCHKHCQPIEALVTNSSTNHMSCYRIVIEGQPSVLRSSAS